MIALARKIVNIKNQLFQPANQTLLGISLGHAFTHWYPTSFYVVLPVIQKSLDLSYTQVGLIISVQYLVSAISNIPGGAIVDMVGRRNLLMALALAWVGLPYFFMGLFGSYAAIIVFVALLGAGNNLWHPAAISELGNRYPERKGGVIGIHSAAANLGDAVGPVVIGLLLVSFTWEKVLMLNVLPGLIMALVIWRILNSRTQEGTSDVQEKTEQQPPSGLSLSQYLSGLRSLIMSPGLMVLLLLSGVRAFTQNSLRTFLPLYFSNVHLLSSAIIGTYLGTVEAAGAVSGPISGYLSDRKGRKIIVILGMLFTALATVFIVRVISGFILILFLVILGFFLYSLRPVFLAWSLELVPEEYGGTTVGLMFGVQSSMASLAPLLGGWVADHWGIKVTLYLVALLLLVCTFFVALTKEDRPVIGEGTPVYKA